MKTKFGVCQHGADSLMTSTRDCTDKCGLKPETEEQEAIRLKKPAHTPTPSRLRPMNTNRVFKPIVDFILDGWYQPPTEKFNDKGQRFYDEAEAILLSLLQNAIEDYQNSSDLKREEVGL